MQVCEYLPGRQCMPSACFGLKEAGKYKRTFPAPGICFAYLSDKLPIFYTHCTRWRSSNVSILFRFFFNLSGGDTLHAGGVGRGVGMLLVRPFSARGPLEDFAVHCNSNGNNGAFLPIIMNSMRIVIRIYNTVFKTYLLIKFLYTSFF